MYKEQEVIEALRKGEDYDIDNVSDTLRA